MRAGRVDSARRRKRRNSPVTQEKELLAERDGHVLVLTLNRPERMNALNHSLLKRELPGRSARPRPTRRSASSC